MEINNILMNLLNIDNQHGLNLGDVFTKIHLLKDKDKTYPREYNLLTTIPCKLTLYTFIHLLNRLFALNDIEECKNEKSILQDLKSKEILEETFQILPDKKDPNNIHFQRQQVKLIDNHSLSDPLCLFIEKLVLYQKSVEILSTSDGRLKIDPATFDAEKYFTIFSKLTLKKPYTLGCTYDGHLDFGGNPILYIQTPAFKKFVEHIRKKRKWLRTINVMLDEILREQKKTLKEIIPEDNKEGYFQLLIFHLLGHIFALSGHAHYSQIEIIYKLDQLIKLSSHHYKKGFEEWKKEMFKNRNFYPVVHLEKKKCLITLFKIEGTEEHIIKETYSIEREAPYTIKTIDSHMIWISSVHVYI